MSKKTFLAQFMEDLSEKSDEKILVSQTTWKIAEFTQKHARVIIAHNAINILLANIIKVNFIKKHSEAQKFMNSINMVQKARLAYILNIINETLKKDLEQIQEIRNKFAHSLDASFNNNDVIKYVRKLSTVNNKKEVTQKNSYTFFEKVANKCFKQVSSIFDKYNSKL